LETVPCVIGTTTVQKSPVKLGTISMNTGNCYQAAKSFNGSVGDGREGSGRRREGGQEKKRWRAFLQPVGF